MRCDHNVLMMFYDDVRCEMRAITLIGTYYFLDLLLYYG